MFMPENHEYMRMKAAIEKLEAERDRLRAALVRIVAGECLQDCDALGVPCPKDIARAALAESEGE